MSDNSSSSPAGHAASARRCSGAEAVAALLRARGVDVAYCLPGEETIDLISALESSGIDLVVCRHEQHAAFMAATHGRLTGSPGLLVTTLGPGMTNALTGLAQADLCRFPLLALCGQKPSRDNREGSFQVLDLPAIATPLTRAATRVTDPAALTGALDQAFRTAATAPQGPVLVELPEDVLAAEVDLDPITPWRAPHPRAEDEAVRSAAQQLGASSRAVVLVGSGAQSSEASEALTSFSEATGVAVVSVQMGKGVVDETHPNALGCLGIHRADAASIGVFGADVVVAVGCQPAEHPPLAWNPDDRCIVIHVSTEPARPEPGYRPTVEVVGDIADSLDRLAAASPRFDVADTQARRTAVHAVLDAERRQARGEHPPNALDVVSALESSLDPADVIALDNGIYKVWFARHHRTRRPQTLLLDNALATMGAGLATAMVAARLHPDRRVVAVCGDGGFLMNVGDLETAIRERLHNLTVVVLNDDRYGFIAWKQDQQDQPNDAVDLGNPDFAALARAFGADGHTVSEASPFTSLLSEASDTAVTVIDCPYDQSINELLGGDQYDRARSLLEGIDATGDSDDA